MFILILRTCTINGALQTPGTTIQVPDAFVLNDKVQQVAAPVVPAPPPAVVAPVVNPPEGSVRIRSTSQVANMIVQAGTVLPPGSVSTATRTRVSSSSGKKGKEESLVEVFHNGQWQFTTVDP